MGGHKERGHGVIGLCSNWDIPPCVAHGHPRDAVSQKMEKGRLPVGCLSEKLSVGVPVVLNVGLILFHACAAVQSDT